MVTFCSLATGLLGRTALGAKTRRWMARERREQVGNVKLEEDVRRRSKGDNQVKTNGSIDNKT